MRRGLEEGILSFNHLVSVADAYETNRTHARSSGRKLTGKFICDIIDPACKWLVGEGVDEVVECTVDATEAGAACEIVGLGPEDPFADVCAAMLSSALEGACVAAVSKGETWGTNQCESACGCKPANNNPPPPPKCLTAPVYIQPSPLNWAQPFNGGDCAGANLMDCEVGGVEYCQQLCEAEPTCSGFTIGGNNECIPKSASEYGDTWTNNVCSTPTGGPDNYWQYYPKQCPTADKLASLWPSVMDYTRLDGDCANNNILQCSLSIDDCSKLCDSMPACMGFSMGGENECIPKTQACLESDSNFVQATDDAYWYFYPKRMPVPDASGSVPGLATVPVPYQAYNGDCGGSNIFPQTTADATVYSPYGLSWLTCYSVDDATLLADAGATTQQGCFDLCQKGEFRSCAWQCNGCYGSNEPPSARSQDSCDSCFQYATMGNQPVTTYEYCEQLCDATANCAGVTFGGAGATPSPTSSGECILKALTCPEMGETPSTDHYWYFFGKVQGDGPPMPPVMPFINVPSPPPPTPA